MSLILFANQSSRLKVGLSGAEGCKSVTDFPSYNPLPVLQKFITSEAVDEAASRFLIGQLL